LQDNIDRFLKKRKGGGRRHRFSIGGRGRVKKLPTVAGLENKIAETVEKARGKFKDRRFAGGEVLNRVRRGKGVKKTSLVLRRGRAG